MPTIYRKGFDYSKLTEQGVLVGGATQLPKQQLASRSGTLAETPSVYPI